MNLNIDGKVFFVTGSTRGVGLGIAKVLLEEGCKVIINGRNRDNIRYVKNILKVDHAENIFAVTGDVSDPLVIQEVIKLVQVQWNNLDGIVANVGAVKQSHDWDINKEEWDWHFTNNFSVAYNTIQMLVPLLTKSKGSIVTVGSIAGLEDVGAPIPYASSKAALTTYTKSLSKKLANNKIRVNMVSPGNIIFPEGNWDKKNKLNPTQVQKMLQDKVPLQMFGTPADIGNVVAFLLSSKARFITGANFVVDGGQTISINS